MYSSDYFRVTDRKVLVDFIADHPFGILVSGSGGLAATHLPFLIHDREGKLILSGHMALANSQWKDLDRSDVLVIFNGPDAYISPSWIPEKVPVPTWNYITVHANGKFSILGREERNRVVKELVEKFEGDGGFSDRVEEDVYQEMLEGTVGFDIVVSAIEGKWKLSQNRPLESRKKIIDGLRSSGNPGDLEIASEMTKTI